MGRTWLAVACITLLVAASARGQEVAAVWSVLAADGEPVLCHPSTHPRHDDADLAPDEFERLLRARSWDELAATLDRSRAAGRPEGRYQGPIELWCASASVKDLEHLDAWCAARPACAWAFLLRGGVGIDHAWEARGSGYADTVMDEAWKVFGERLALAGQRLRRAVELDPKGPWAPTKLIAVAMAGGIPREEGPRWFERAVALDPRHVPAYIAMTTFLLPRWHGSPEAALSFVDEAMARRKDEPALVACLVWALQLVDQDPTARLARPGLKERVVAGLEAAIEAYPAEWALRNAQRTVAGLLADGALLVEALEGMATTGLDREAAHQAGLTLLRGGVGVMRDEARGVRLLCKAAHWGHAEAQHRFAALLCQGAYGLPRDGEGAKAWYIKADAGGYVGAAAALGVMLYDGDVLPADHAAARPWLEKAANAGVTMAMGRLGDLCFRGVGGPRDPKAAEQWLQKGIRGGDPAAMVVMGQLIEERQPAEAARMYRAAAPRSPRARELLDDLLRRRPELRTGR